MVPIGFDIAKEKSGGTRVNFDYFLTVASVNNTTHRNTKGYPDPAKDYISIVNIKKEI